MEIKLRRQRSRIYSKSMVNKQILRRSCFVHLYKLRKATTARNMGDKGSHDVSGDCFWIFERIVMFSISWCYLVPSNSRQSNRFLVTVVHRGTCEGDFAEKTPTNQQWGQQTVAEKGNFTQKKKVCWVSLHLTWKKHTHVNSKKKALQANRDPRCFGNAPAPGKKNYPHLVRQHPELRWIWSSLIEQRKTTLAV